MFHEYDMVKLLKNIPEEQLTAGAMGVIQIVHDVPGLPIAYVVEFTNDMNEVVILTLLEKEIEL